MASLVKQGAVGDCWLLAVVNSLLLSFPDFLHRIVRPVPGTLQYEVLLGGCRFLVNTCFNHPGAVVQDTPSFLCRLLEKAVCIWLSLNPTPLTLKRRQKAGVSSVGYWWRDIDGGYVEKALDLLIGVGMYTVVRCALGHCLPGDLIIVIRWCARQAGWHSEAYVPSMLLPISTPVMAVRLTAQALALLS